MSDMAANIREHMEIIGEDGRHVGTVDGIEGDMIKLTKNDPEAGGKHHYLPLDLVSSVDGNQVTLMIPADQALLEGDIEGVDDGGMDTTGDDPA